MADENGVEPVDERLSAAFLRYATVVCAVCGPAAIRALEMVQAETAKAAAADNLSEAARQKLDDCFERALQQVRSFGIEIGRVQ